MHDPQVGSRPIGRYLGCLYGVAVGDALGAPIEFLSWEQICERYGPDGITDLESWADHPAGSFTDDTGRGITGSHHNTVRCITVFRFESDLTPAIHEPAVVTAG